MKTDGKHLNRNDCMTAPVAVDYGVSINARSGSKVMVGIVGAGGPSDSAAIPLGTRRGTHIRNERRREFPPPTLRASVRLWARERPKARLRSLTALYNCMGMLFAARRTHIDPDQLDLILREDEYRRVSSIDETEVGDIVIYRRDRSREVEHVGMILGKTRDLSHGAWIITVLSKWGAEGEYEHPLEHVPEILGRPVEFWTDRRSL